MLFGKGFCLRRDDGYLLASSTIHTTAAALSSPRVIICLLLRNIRPDYGRIANRRRRLDKISIADGRRL